MMKIKGLIHKIFRKTGYDFLRYVPENFCTLKRCNLIRSENINLFLDVGANKGDYVAALRDSGYQNRVVSFEPLSKPFRALQQRAGGDSRWLCINAACGRNDCEAEMFVSGHETSSSLLSITDTHRNAMPSSVTVSKENVNIRTLDSLIGSIIQPEDRIFLKIDVQGYEMFVLQGAMQTLRQVRAAELELSFAPLYQGAPFFNEMMKYMEEHGFALVSLNHVFSDPKSDQLLQVDGIFRKTL